MNKLDFLKDEVRSGFYIPTAIKQAWSAQLAILSELDRVCRKYNLEYFADWGTFLGTVRHKGYVPWDDDMDVCMKRADYERFKQIAHKELPKGYAIHDYATKEDHWLFLSRLVNTNRICFDKEHLDQFNNFPYIATIDIFVLDYLYQDDEKEKERCEEVKFIISLADGIVDRKLSKDTIALNLAQIEKKYGCHMDGDLSPRKLGIELYRLAEKQMARVSADETDRIGQIFPWVLKGGKGFPKSYYEKLVRLPFEYTTMPVPASFHEALKNHYGSYFDVHKVWNAHDYPYFEGQRANLQAVADFKLPEFTFDQSMIREYADIPKNDGSLKALAKECIDGLADMAFGIRNAQSSGNYDALLDILPECQQLAVDLGTLIEDVKGKERNCTALCVSALESLCEKLFVIYEGVHEELDDETLIIACDDFSSAMEKVCETIQTQIIERKELLFVATGAKRWKGFEALYHEFINDDGYDVSVVAVPVMKKDAFGQIIMSGKEFEEAQDTLQYPKEVAITPWDTYDVALHNPDIIYIQDVYDGENPCLTIPPAYYTKNIRQYTDELIYIPYLETCEFDRNDRNDIYNMKHYVTAPGVCYADKVMVQSENIKCRYIEKLVEFAGEETRSLWERKLFADKLPVTMYDEEHVKSLYDAEGRKKMLFCISANLLIESRDVLIEKLKEKLQVFHKYKDDIGVDLCIYPPNEAVWEDINSTLAGEVFQLIEDNKKDGMCGFIDISDMEYSDIAKSYNAYYGGASPLVHSFGSVERPVMIADI